MQNSRTLEITIISCEDLTSNWRPIKKSTFATIQSNPKNSFQTKIVKEGGPFPYWNEKSVIELPAGEKYLTVQVHSVNGRIIGAAKIPVTDFIEGYVPEGYLHLLSYRLRDANGEPSGIINFSVRIKVPERRGVQGRMWDLRRGCNFGTGYGGVGGVVQGIPVPYGSWEA